ncbi:arsenate reductase/protein-tyrosine-phosphatase family protein [Geodermatophilus sp. SYSU D00700]
MPRHWLPEPVFAVLLVCTGNICRSPLAECLGRAYLKQVLEKDAGLVRLSSAGVRAVVGSAMHPDSALVLRGLGGDPDGFVACQLVEDMVIDADLTLTLTRDHRREVLRVAPRALNKTFTLREAADLVELVGEDVAVAGDGLPERARNLVKHLAAARSRRQSSPDDDVRDPIGLPAEVHAEVGDVIARALLPVLARIAALRPGDVGRPDQDELTPSPGR